MPKRKRSAKPEPDEDEDEDEDEDDAEDEAEEQSILRDFFLARLAAARSRATDAITAIDEIVELTVNADEDASGKKRDDALETALEALGSASRSVESAEGVWEDVDSEEGEPDEDEDEDNE